MAETKEDFVYMAKLAEQAERYDGKYYSLYIVIMVGVLISLPFLPMSLRNGWKHEKSCCRQCWAFRGGA